MSTDISAYRPTVSLASHAQPVPMTGSLAYHVEGAAMHAHYSPTHDKPSRQDIIEAKGALPRVEHLCRPPDVRVIGQWLEKFVTLPKAPTSAPEGQKVAAAMALANGDLPVCVWTAETAADGLRRWKWYPTPAEVRELLEPIARRFWTQRDGLRRVVDWAAPNPGQSEPKTPEAVEHVRNLVSTFAAERSFHVGGADLPREVKARPLSTLALCAQYRKLAADGDKAAALRLRMLDGRNQTEHTP
jgi:hypothetical protein